MSDVKQVIVLRSDIEMSKGKSIAQACHASLGAYESAENDAKEEWRAAGDPKIVLEHEDLEQLRNEAQRSGLPHKLVTDAGRTELEPGTVTALGIGPAEESKIDPITGDLDLVS